MVHDKAASKNSDPRDNTRPAALGITGWPFPAEEPRPLLDWPNSESIRKELLLMAEEQAAERLGLEPRNPGHDPMVSDKAASTLAPNLDGTVAQAIELHDMPGPLLTLLDEEVRETAKRVKGALRPEQFEQLVLAAAGGIAALIIPYP